VRSRARVLLVAAAGLTAASLALPLWGVRMTAPQYPDEALTLRIDRHGIGGDVQEVETLQQYIGVRFPDEMPELEWLPVVVLALTGLLLAGAVAGGQAARALRVCTAVVFVLFLAGSAAIVQKRLYDVGHDRDPNAPIKAVKTFTPPIVGPAKVGNFTVWSFPHLGGVALLLAAALAGAGARPERAV
jgi:copper chaperone NosL